VKEQLDTIPSPVVSPYGRTDLAPVIADASRRSVAD